MRKNENFEYRGHEPDRPDPSAFPLLHCSGVLPDAQREDEDYEFEAEDETDAGEDEEK